MTRISFFVAFVLAALWLSGPAVAQPDKKAALDKAKAKFEAESAKADEALVKALETAITKSKGNKSALEKLEFEKDQFVNNRLVPTTVPVEAYLKARTKAQAGLESAYQSAIKELLKAKKDAEADALEAEWSDLLKTSRGYGLAFPELEGKPVFHIESKSTGLVVEPVNKNGTGELMLVSKVGKKKREQCWQLEREPKGYVIRNVASGHTFNVWYRNKDVGGLIHTWNSDRTKETDPANLFQISEVRRELMILPSVSDLALVASERKEKGVTTYFVTQDKKQSPPAPNQRWTLVEAK